MSTNSVKNRQRAAPMMMWVTLFAGVLGLLVQLIPDGTMLTFLVGVSAIAGLAGSRKIFDERENQLLWQSYGTAFEYLFIVIYFTYAFVEFAGWLHFAGGLIIFVQGHWIGLTASTMCILLGFVGVRNFRDLQNTI
jgi:hypothetical protein